MNPKIPISDEDFLPRASIRSISTEFEVEPSHFSWEKADVKDALFVTDRLIKHASGENQIALLLEPFSLHPENYFEAMRKPFRYVLTPNRYFADNIENWLWYPLGGTLIPEADRKLYRKSKNISMIVSDKSATAGHRLRKAIAEMISSECPGEVDIFGADGYVPKLDCLRDYRCSIVVENDKADGLFSEKLLDCFLTGTLPVYWGCRDIKDYFHKETIFSFRNKNSFFDTLSDCRYSLRHEALQYSQSLNFKIAQDYLVSEDYIWNHYRFLFEK